MKAIGKNIVKGKWLILILTVLLMIPSVLGYVSTKINYDILVYLPDDIETIKGENILTDEFHSGAFSIVVTNGMSPKNMLKLEEKFKTIDSVEKVMSVNDLATLEIPDEVKQMLGKDVDLEALIPKEMMTKLALKYNGLILVTFRNSTSDDKTLAAVDEIRDIVKDKAEVGGMSAMVLDTKELFNSEMLLYVVIAVILCILILELSLDSYIVPFILIINIGIAILFNMGSNILLGNISYITKAIAAVLQLGVTTDFSIFLYHKYENRKEKENDNNKAMEEAIHDTFTSILGSSLTTIAGFLALCTMTLTLGFDIGVVMAKGVLIGVLCVLTIFPSLLLVCDKVIEKTKHKKILPEFNHIKNFVFKHHLIIFILFIVLLVPAYIFQTKTEVYYKLDESIPDNYGYRVATKKLQEKYGLVSQEMILIPKDMDSTKVEEMVEKVKAVKGIDFVISSSSLAKLGIPEELVPPNLRTIYESKNYKMIIVGSKYDIATDELNDQITTVNKIIKGYDKDIILAGEGPLTKDLVDTTEIDLRNVSITSIAVIFIIMLLVLKSITLPILLVTAIEFAIFINMSVPYFMGTKLPFVATVVIGTIQLGATIDYAILMTTKYLEERKTKDKEEAVKGALDNSVSSIIVSAMCFFGATVGVGIVSKVDMIGSLCILLCRGAIISMLVVICIVPSLLLIFDKLIVKTTLLKNKKD